MADLVCRIQHKRRLRLALSGCCCQDHRMMWLLTLLPTPALNLCPQEPAQSVRYVVVVVYVGNETAAEKLVVAAEEDLNKVGDLINAVSAATDGQITVTQVSCCPPFRPVAMQKATGC